jgi:hypothetical protein
MDSPDGRKIRHRNAIKPKQGAARAATIRLHNRRPSGPGTIVVAGQTSLERIGEARKILFLMAEVAKRNFRGPEQWEALTGAYLALAGKPGLNAADARAIRRALAQ